MPDYPPKVRLGTETLPPGPVCACAAAHAVPEGHEPGCDRALHPYVGFDTWALVKAAVKHLSGSRDGPVGDARAELSCLASLVAEAQSQLPEAVSDAREQGDSWAQVASRLAVAASTARRRYADYDGWRAGLGLMEDG